MSGRVSAGAPVRGGAGNMSGRGTAGARFPLIGGPSLPVPAAALSPGWGPASTFTDPPSPAGNGGTSWLSSAKSSPTTAGDAGFRCSTRNVFQGDRRLPVLLSLCGDVAVTSARAGTAGITGRGMVPDASISAHSCQAC